MVQEVQIFNLISEFFFLRQPAQCSVLKKFDSKLEVHHWKISPKNFLSHIPLLKWAPADEKILCPVAGELWLEADWFIGSNKGALVTMCVIQQVTLIWKMDLLDMVKCRVQESGQEMGAHFTTPGCQAGFSSLVSTVCSLFSSFVFLKYFAQKFNGWMTTLS